MTNRQTAPEPGQLLTVGERLSLARERAGLSVGQFAELVGMHRNNVPRWEARHADPSMKVIRLYAEHTDATAEWLAFEIGDWPSVTVGVSMSNLAHAPAA